MRTQNSNATLDTFKEELILNNISRELTELTDANSGTVLIHCCPDKTSTGICNKTRISQGRESESSLFCYPTYGSPPHQMVGNKYTYRKDSAEQLRVTQSGFSLGEYRRATCIFTNPTDVKELHSVCVSRLNRLFRERGERRGEKRKKERKSYLLGGTS